MRASGSLREAPVARARATRARERAGEEADGEQRGGARLRDAQGERARSGAGARRDEQVERAVLAGLAGLHLEDDAEVQPRGEAERHELVVEQRLAASGPALRS